LVNAHPRQSLKLELRKRYNLCSYCISRHLTVGRGRLLDDDFDRCYICCGLMNRLDFIIGRIEETVKEVYEFDTFLIGTILPPDIYEREDQIRARLKIRGKESIKNQLLNELRRNVRNYYKEKSRLSLTRRLDNRSCRKPDGSQRGRKGTYVNSCGPLY